ncbi:immunoglobulin I-set domain protein [Cooperia oncophora]
MFSEFLRSDDELTALEGNDRENTSGAPVITSPPKDVSFAVGTASLRLSCIATGLPTPSITWRFNDRDITSDSTKYDVIADSLIIHDLKKSDSGSYSCIARNNNGMTSATARVTSTDRDITSDSTKYDVIADSLIIHDLKKSDSGSYSCIARNNNGMTSATARVTSTGSNLIEYGPTNQSVVIGTNIMIPCEVSPEYKQNAQLMWFINDEPIPINGNPGLRLSRDKKGGLLIQQVGPDSIGEYRCTVMADGREESASAFLRIIERPQMPTFVRAELINTTLPAKIRVSWVEGFDGNSPIIKHSVEMRTVGPTQLWSDWETVVDNVPTRNAVLFLSIIYDHR